MTPPAAPLQLAVALGQADVADPLLDQPAVNHLHKRQIRDSDKDRQLAFHQSKRA